MLDKKHCHSLTEQILSHTKKWHVDVAISGFIETGFSVTARNGDVETLEHHQNKHVDITVYYQQRLGTASTTDFSFDAIQKTADKAFSIARYTGEDPFSGLADSNLLAYDYPDLDLFHPWELTPQHAIDIAIDAEKIALQQDKRVKHSEGVSISTFKTSHFLANNRNFFGSYLTTEHSMSCGLIAEENGHMERDYEYTVSHDPMTLLDPNIVAKKASEKTLRRLGARRLKTQRCPVIFYAPVARTLFSSFVSAISGSNLYRGTSFLLDQLEKPIFQREITLHQEPHALGVMGSAPFDSDGVKTKNICYVQDGILKSYSLGSYSARKLGMQSTGNAGGVYNLLIHHSDKTFSDLLKEMGRGLLVTELMGQGVSILTGNYSRGAFGFWVDKGEIQYPVHEITIASNLKDIFKGIIGIANDVDYRKNIKSGSLLIDQMTVAGE